MSSDLSLLVCSHFLHLLLSCITFLSTWGPVCLLITCHALAKHRKIKTGVETKVGVWILGFLAARMSERKNQIPRNTALMEVPKNWSTFFKISSKSGAKSPKSFFALTFLFRNIFTSNFF